MAVGDPIFKGTEQVGLVTGPVFPNNATLGVVEPLRGDNAARGDVVERSYPVDSHTTYEWAIAYEYATFSGQTPWGSCNEHGTRLVLAMYREDPACKSARLLRRTLRVEEVA